jgi:hypothetical protein
LLLNRILEKQGSTHLKVETDVQSIGPETRKQLLSNSDFGMYLNRLKMYVHVLYGQRFAALCVSRFFM